MVLTIGRMLKKAKKTAKKTVKKAKKTKKKVATIDAQIKDAKKKKDAAANQFKFALKRKRSLTVNKAKLSGRIKYPKRKNSNEIFKIKKAEKNLDELYNYIKDLEERLSTIGDDAQLANIDLQNMLQKQQQTLQTISNVSKMLHDTAMAIIRKIG